MTVIAKIEEVGLAPTEDLYQSEQDVLGEKRIMVKGNHSTWLVRPLQTLTMGAFLLSAVAHSQAIGAAAKNNTAPSASQDDVKVMRQQIQALAARVKQLEEQANQASGDSGDDKQNKAVERRLEALEREQAKLDGKHQEQKGGDATDRPERLTVVAPFSVVDGEGKLIMRVGEEGEASYSRGIYAFDGGGRPVAHMGSLQTGGRFYAKGPNSKVPELVLGVGTKGPGILMNDASGEKVTMGYESLTFRGDGNAVLSQFGTKNKGKGYLELNDSSGIMVEAGALDSHKGYVLANPYRASPDLRGDPSVLKGGGK